MKQEQKYEYAKEWLLNLIESSPFEISDLSGYVSDLSGYEWSEILRDVADELEE